MTNYTMLLNIILLDFFFLMNKSDVQSWRDYKEIKLLSRNTKLWEREAEAR